MKAIEIIMLSVRDQTVAKEFYLKLGFEVVVEAPANHGQTWLQMALPGEQTSIALMAVDGIIITTDDIKKEIAKLNNLGIEVSKIDEQPWGKFAWLKDTDGNGLCLHEK